MVLRLHLLTAILLCASSVPPAALAASRTFLFAPADLAAAIEDFNAEVISRSGELGRGVALRKGAVRIGPSQCFSIGNDPKRRLTRLRFLDRTERTDTVASRPPALTIANVLSHLGAVGWLPPATATRTRQPNWSAPGASGGIAEFAVTGFAAGDGTGGIDRLMVPDHRGTFRVDLDVAPAPQTGMSSLVVAFTTEVPPARPGRAPKRSECFALARAFPADVQALVDLLAETPLDTTTRSRLRAMLSEAEHWVSVDQPLRAARSTRAFALEVARRSALEISPAHAETLIARALAAVEALGL